MNPRDALDADTLETVNSLFADVTAKLEDAASVAAGGQRASLKRAEALEIAHDIHEKCRSIKALIDLARIAVGDDDGIAPDTEH